MGTQAGLEFAQCIDRRPQRGSDLCKMLICCNPSGAICEEDALVAVNPRVLEFRDIINKNCLNRFYSCCRWPLGLLFLQKRNTFLHIVSSLFILTALMQSQIHSFSTRGSASFPCSIVSLSQQQGRENMLKGSKMSL